MKKLCLAAGVVLLAILAGCAGSPIQLTPISIPIIPPTQLVQQICPVVNADLTALSTSTLLTSTQKDLLTNTIIPGNDKVCSAVGTINISDLQAFNATVFPALVTIVAAVPAIPNQPAILLGLTLAQPILTQVVNVAVAAVTQTTAASAIPAASAPSAASAPAAASAP
jgi:hypothetical protein